MTILLSFLLLWTIFRGEQTLTINPSCLEKWVFHGTRLLAQLHQEWLKLWGLSTLQSPESNLWRDLLRWLITVPLSPDLTVDCVFCCLSVTERSEALVPGRHRLPEQHVCVVEHTKMAQQPRSPHGQCGCCCMSSRDSECSYFLSFFLFFA